MHVLIIGVNGFLGQHVATRCLQEGMRVDGVYHTKKSAIPNGCIVYPSSVLSTLRDVYDAVFIVSASIPRSGQTISEAALVETNTQLPFRVALQFQKSFLVFASSVSVYKKPLDIYGKTKRVAEMLIEQCHKKTAIIRFSSLYGKGMYQGTFLPRIIADAKKKKRITLFGDGKRKQDYLHVTDAAALCIQAAKKQKTGIFLGAYGMSYTNNVVAKQICLHIKGCGIHHTGIDRSPSYSYDVSYTKKQLNFVPTMSLEQGIGSMI